MDLRRENDIEQLRRITLEHDVQIEQLRRVLQAQCEDLQALKGDPAELQQTLALVETLTKQRLAARKAAGEPASAKKTPKPREVHGPTPPPNLPLVEQVFELDEADRACPCGGGKLCPIAGEFEESEMVDVVEVSYRVVKVKQQKYLCRCGGAVETALGPERAVRGGRYSLDFAIKVALDKYLDHIPLARQERIMHRHGLEVTPQTLWDQLDALAKRLEHRASTRAAPYRIERRAGQIQDVALEPSDAQVHLGRQGRSVHHRELARAFGLSEQRLGSAVTVRVWTPRKILPGGASCDSHDAGVVNGSNTRISRRDGRRLTGRRRGPAASSDGAAARGSGLPGASARE